MYVYFRNKTFVEVIKCNFVLQYQYIFKQTGDKKKEIHPLSDIIFTSKFLETTFKELYDYQYKEFLTSDQ